MLPDQVSNPGLLTYESDALPIALRGQAGGIYIHILLRSSGGRTSLGEWEHNNKEIM